jgi:starch synthase (maltosyl-transferring)
MTERHVPARRTGESRRAALQDQPDPETRRPVPGRVIVEHVEPEIDAGQFPIKRTIGESVMVTADAFADGHDLLAGVLKFRHAPRDGPSAEVRRDAPDHFLDVDWREVPLAAIGNDRWGASFTVTELGTYEYIVEAWIDRFATWRKGLIAKFEAGQDVSSELLEGAELVQAAAGRLKPTATSEPYVGAGFSRPKDSSSSPSEGSRRPEGDLKLLEIADVLRSPVPQAARVATARDPELLALMEQRPDRSTSTTYERALRVTVDPGRALFSAWYEMFPRSCTPDPSRSGTFREAEVRLPEIESMGFDVLYLPPIHPIGRTHRKGPNNSLTSAPGDPGSPWAIGADEGGHTAIEPGLGTFEDFDRFVGVANRLGLEVALDIAFQASPDHPWVREHPEWFKHRPDGTIKYAENPPKKYQDIYPFDFETPAWRSLWHALRDVFLFWIEHGVTIFRVDNPHTKSFRFWQWCIAEIRRDHPEAMFLSEAFTRPKVMRHLAKAGFTQSYTYFTWRNSAHELREYLTELTTTEVREYMRPNFFANTPDILHEYLQTGGRPAFEVRLVLAATLSASYGIYSGYELCENVPVRPGSEEYLNSEKYQLRPRDFNQPNTLRELIGQVNRIRREHPALQHNNTLAFHPTDNDALLWYSKTSGTDRVFVVANTDPHHLQHGNVQVPIRELGIPHGRPYVVQDLLDEARYTWRDEWNYVRLDPSQRMSHIFVIRQ